MVTTNTISNTRKGVRSLSNLVNFVEGDAFHQGQHRRHAHIQGGGGGSGASRGRKSQGGKADDVPIRPFMSEDCEYVPIAFVNAAPFIDADTVLWIPLVSCSHPHPLSAIECVYDTNIYKI